jgi:predicted nucleic acid-binding protein
VSVIVPPFTGNRIPDPVAVQLASDRGEAMTTAVKAVCENGVFKPKEPVQLVDCLSIVMMRKLGINEAWAVESDFTHHGFLVRPGPRP